MAFRPTRLRYRHGRCSKALDTTQLQAKPLALGIGQGKGFEVELAGRFLTAADHTDEPFTAAFDDLDPGSDFAFVLGIVHGFPRKHQPTRDSRTRTRFRHLNLMSLRCTSFAKPCRANLSRRQHKTRLAQD
ncbi:hypothetical protein [Mesorhizobium sp.]|uniref:hypothetical protein n=1 Tax=Mesorhizobium sp. TaxID=1871066 RepID=UPI0025C16B0C|nr:hypothetical protein [Mesorhizobium sp.]